MAVNVIQALGFDVRVYKVTNGARRVQDSYRSGVLAPSGVTTTEATLSPAVGNTPAQSITIPVRTCISIRSARKPITVTVTRTPASGPAVAYTQKVSELFTLTPVLADGETCSVTITHSNLVATDVLVVSA